MIDMLRLRRRRGGDAAAPRQRGPAEAPASGEHAPPGPAEAVPDLAGWIDRIGAGTVQGWAASRSEPTRRLKLRLYLDDTLSAEGVAAASRDDVREAGYGDGHYGFDLPVPKKALFCAETLTVVAVDEDGVETTVHRHVLRGPITTEGPPALYMDASDLVEFLTHHRELSGIQRVQAGYLLGLGNAVIAGTQVRICTRLKTSSFYFDLAYDAFASLLKAAGDVAIVPKSRWADHVRAFKGDLVARTELKPGDTIFTMGAPWALDDHNETIRCAKLFYGAHYLQVFYDLIPISVPEVVAAPLIPHFARAMAAMAVYADHIYAISRYSKDDLAETLARLKRPVPPIDVVPMGGTITDAEGGDASEPGAVLRALGVEGPFVLCVGTLEPRKNHALLFQVWRRLVSRHGAAKVPKLVLVGRVGWYMEDFMRQLKITGYVEGTVVHMQGVSNAELAALYDACLFTAFPSFSEGWGLPITESLARGKICVCSDVTSMPEAGGGHALYIDPFDTTGAYDVCERLIYDPAYQAEQLARARGFVTTSWADASDGLHAQFAELVPRLAALPNAARRKPVELGRSYKFYNIEAASPDATSTEVFRNFLDQEDALDLLEGWNWFELDVNCTWACGPEARLSLILPESEKGFVAYLDCIVPPAYEGVVYEVSIDGALLGDFRGSGFQTLRLEIPANAALSCSLALNFLANSKPSVDARLLGMGLKQISIFDAIDCEGRVRYLEDQHVTLMNSDACSASGRRSSSE